MVKLIRLTSVNDGNFETNFDAEIVLKPNSKLALLNATFATVFDSITITEINNKISFRSKADGVTSSFFMTPKLYQGKQGTQDFLDDVALGLNSTLKATKLTPETQNQFSEFRVNDLLNNQNGDTASIFYNQVPLCSPMGPTYRIPNSKQAYRTRNMQFWETDPAIINITDVDRNTNFIQVENGVTATPDRNHHFITSADYPLSKGNALFMCQTMNWADNGSGLQDNGYGIGLTQVNLQALGFPKNADLPNDSRQLEIRYNRVTETYKYIDDNLTEKDSGIMPIRVTDYFRQNNDALWFRIGQSSSAEFEGKQTVAGGLWQVEAGPGTVATEYIFFERLLTIDETQGDWYPYMYIRGARDDITVAAMAYTPSLKNITDYENWEQVFQLAGGQIPPGTVRSPAVGDYNQLEVWNGADGLLGVIAPRLVSNRWMFIGVIPNPTNTILRITLSPQLWEYLGFKNTSSSGIDQSYIESNLIIITGNEPADEIGKFPFGAKWGAEVESALNLNDCFVVEVENLPLDCYDASASSYGVDKGGTGTIRSPRRGRRKNILMTLPVNDNNNGLVQYNSNSPIFIDIRNTAPVLLKNLSLKILKKDFTPIHTANNESIITLLLDTGN